MKSPPEEKPLLGCEGLRQLITLGQYSTLALLANILGAVFWFFEQRRGQFMDRLENERSAQ